MIVPASAFATALNAMRGYARKVDRAAASVASAGLDVRPAEPHPGEATSQPTVAAPAAPNPDSGYADSMTTMLTAQRAFMEQQRVLDAAKVMLGEAVKLRAANPEK